MPFGNWFAPAEITGTRVWGSPAVCQCWNATAGRAAEKAPRVDRVHPAIETRDQYWFQETTAQVCATVGEKSGRSGGGSHGSHTTTTSKPQAFDSAAAARVAGASVSNCGQCGKCSAVHDVNTMHQRSKSLTKIASWAHCASALGSTRTGHFFVRPGSLGFEKVRTCWLEATRCNIASCAALLFRVGEPFVGVVDSGRHSGLNACMQCDEVRIQRTTCRAAGRIGGAPGW